MADPRFEIGKAGAVVVDGVTLNVTGWNASEESDWQETTHSGSLGYYEDIPGIQKVSGAFSGSIDLDDVPNLDLAAGSTVALVLDYELNNHALSLAKAGIDSFEVTSEVKGVINFSCKYHSIGAYAWAQ